MLDSTCPACGKLLLVAEFPSGVLMKKIKHPRCGAILVIAEGGKAVYKESDVFIDEVHHNIILKNDINEQITTELSEHMKKERKENNGQKN